MLGKRDITFFEEFLPSDSLGPITNPLIFVGIRSICRIQLTKERVMGGVSLGNVIRTGQIIFSWIGTLIIFLPLI